MTNKINIKELLPLLKDGWVAVDKDGTWGWYVTKPTKEDIYWYWGDAGYKCVVLSDIFNLEPADDWEKSLMRCGNNQPLKLEVGKFYRTRDGNKAVVISKDDAEQPFVVTLLYIGDSYRVDEKGIYRYDKEECKYDIISEWE